ncbi:MAG: hypothetical protein N3B12_09180, partial [Armatimonadetes bacterium]|nr:hypothetical protein [Armatimonadota bacterium]
MVVLCAPVVAMAILGAAHLVHQTRLLLTDAQWILGDALSQYFGREVRVGRARLAPLGSAVIEKLEIADGPTFASGKMVLVRRITVRYDVGGVIVGGMGASGIRSIEVVDPEVRIVRRPDGSLNVMELIKPSVGPPGPPFKGCVTVSGGRISFVDWLSRGHGRPTILNLHNLNARLNGGSYPVWGFQFSGVGKPGQLTYVQGVGEFDQVGSTLRIDAAVSGVSVPLLVSLAGATDRVKVSAGTADAAVGLATRVPIKGIPSVTGMVRLAGVEAGMPGLSAPAERVGGTIALMGNRAVLNLSGFVFGSRAAVSGSVTGFDNPRVYLNMSLSALGVDSVLRAIGVSRLPHRVQIGHVSSFSATLGGVLAEPAGQASMTLSQISAFGYSARDVRLSVGYSNGELFLSSLKFSVDGADVEACGKVGLAGVRNIAIRGSVRGLSIGKLPLPPEARAEGFANVDFVVSGLITKPRVFARVAATSASFGCVDVPALFAEFDLDVQSLRVTGVMAMNVADGLVQIRGIGGVDRVDLADSAEAIDLSTVGSILKNVDLSGIVYAAGRVFGDPKNPTVTGGVEVFNSRYADTELDYMRMAFSANKRKATVKEGIVRIFPTEMRFAGTAAGFAGGRVIDFRGEAHVKRLQTNRLSELVGRDIDITGTIAGDFAFSGAYMPNAKLEPGDSRIKGATVDGTLRLDDGLAYGFIVNTAGARVALRDNVLTLSEASIVSGDARVGLSGTINIESKQADIAFEMTGFDLARVRDRVENYLTISGLASARGTAVSYTHLRAH